MYDPEYSAFWQAHGRLRAGEGAPGDLGYVLSLAETFWVRMIDAELKAAAYDRMREAYAAKPSRSTKERQAAACRAGGLTRTDGPGPRLDRPAILARWYALTRETPRDPERALATLAQEWGIKPASMAHNLRTFVSEIDALISTGHPDSPMLRAHRDALTSPPARIPAEWGE